MAILFSPQGRLIQTHTDSYSRGSAKRGGGGVTSLASYREIQEVPEAGGGGGGAYISSSRDYAAQSDSGRLCLTKTDSTADGD